MTAVAPWVAALEAWSIAEYAREYVVATSEYEDDRYSPSWPERAARAHLARAALWGACGYVNACENDDGADSGLAVMTEPEDTK